MESTLSVKWSIIFQMSISSPNKEKIQQIIQQGNKYFKPWEYIIFDFYYQIYKIPSTNTYIYNFSNLEEIVEKLIGLNILTSFNMFIYDSGDMILKYISAHPDNIRIKHCYYIHNIDSLTKKDIINLLLKYKWLMNWSLIVKKALEKKWIKTPASEKDLNKLDRDLLEKMLKWILSKF